MTKEEIEAMKDGTFEKIMDFIQTRPQNRNYAHIL